MNKAKALFSGAMVFVIAGASGAMWYLNENGVIGKDNVTQPDAYIEYEDAYDSNEENDFGYDNNREEVKETTTVAAEDEKQLTDEEINDFLSVFTMVYFSEKDSYTPQGRSTYELIRFAYSHIKRTDSSLIETRQEDDSIGYYNRVSAKEINKVLNEYLNVSVSAESVYTENDFAFFRYEDGYFLTPAADGLPFVNRAVCDSAEYNDGTVSVEFSVYSGDDVYARGEAEISMTEGRPVLIFYDVTL